MNLMDAASLATLSVRPIETRMTRSQILAAVGAENSPRLVSEKFFYARVPINKIASPTKTTRVTTGPIVVDINAGKEGRLKNGFAPEVIVIAGHKAFDDAHIRRQTRVPVWLGELAAAYLGVQPDDELGTDEIRRLIQRALDRRRGIRASAHAVVTDVLPFEGYCLYAEDRKTYRQAFGIMEEAREVSLIGQPVELRRTAAKDTTALAAAIEACACQDEEKRKEKLDMEYCGYDDDDEPITAGSAVRRYRAAVKASRYTPKAREVAAPGWENIAASISQHPDIESANDVTWYLYTAGYKPRTKSLK